VRAPAVATLVTYLVITRADAPKDDVLAVA